MEKENTMFQADSIVRVDGQLVRVIAADHSGDDTVLQWGVLVSNPDAEVWFTQSQVSSVEAF